MARTKPSSTKRAGPKTARRAPKTPAKSVASKTKASVKSSSSSAWCAKKLAELHARTPEHTSVLVVDSNWIGAVAASVVGAHTAGKAFRDDLQMSKTCWFYHPVSHRRCLLLYAASTEASAMRGLGQKAAAALQGMKIAKVDFVWQCPADGAAVGNFESSFYTANFEKVHRIACKAQNFASSKPTDSRTNRLASNVEGYKVHAESEGFRSSQAYIFQMAMARARETSKSLAIVRGSVATPEWMTAQARALAKGQKLIKEVRVLKGRELVAHGMNLFHNVGRGAVCPPAAVFIHYVGRPGDKTVDLALVGKGVTYDTGGLNIKMALMEKMYGDKGGSTAVLGALRGCLDLKLKKNIVFACGFAENAVGNAAYKPSDILRAMNGLSVQIGNTDAEGRLVMADTMTYV